MAPGRRAPFLVVAAVEEELAPLRKRIEAEGDPSRAVLVVTGVGKACAALETALAVERHAPRLCLQVGCAGAFPGAGLRMADVAVAELEALGDEGVETPVGFVDLARMGLPLARWGGEPIFNEVPVTLPDAGLLAEIRGAVAGRFSVLVGRFVTVSTVSGSAGRALEIQRRWRPIAESMEGAAGALACARLGCPFLEVRGISNEVGERDPSKWNIAAAADHAAEVAARLLAGYSRLSVPEGSG